MKQIKGVRQNNTLWTNYKRWRKLVASVLTFAIILTMLPFTAITTFAASSYNINTTDVTTIQSLLSSIATVSESDGIITITLTNNVNGMILFEGSEETTFVLDAAGHTINGSGQNEAIQLTNGNNATVILKGNGTYLPGLNNTVYAGYGGKLIIESGTFNAPTSGSYIIRSTAFFELAEGYDYYTVTTNGGNLFASHNRKEKSSYSIPLNAGQLVVSQCNGEVPSYNIENLATTNGSYSVQVNGAEATSAKADDTVTVTFNPNTNYRYSGMVVKKTNTGTNYLDTSGGNGVSHNFDMPDSDVSIDVSFAWYNQIMTQPTAENPTVVTNNPDGVSSYQWYNTSVVNYTVVDGTAGTGEVSADYVFSGNYDTTSKTWSSNGNLYLYYDGFETGDQLIFSQITGNVTFCDGTLQEDGSYVYTNPSSFVRITFSSPGGSCKITVKKNVKVAVEGQTSDTYTGPEGNVCAKVTFTNSNVLTSNTITYTPYQDYQIIDGSNAVFESVNAGSLSFRSNADFTKFIGVEVDGQIIDAQYYDVKSGSTIVTLKADYLKTLSLGKHTLTIVSNDGEAGTNFEIKATSNTNNEVKKPSQNGDISKSEYPNTGDNSDLILLIALVLTSGVVAVKINFYRKKRE